MKFKINKLKEEVEKLNDQLIITESERGEAEDNRKMLSHLFESNMIDKMAIFCKSKIDSEHFLLSN